MASKDRSMSPETPSSPLNRSLDLSSSTIDELTNALSDLTSQEPASAVICCCRKDDCEHTTSWLAVKTHLESRLILSAEVGQALLHKHEAYVRQLEKTQHKRTRSKPVWNGSRNDGEEAEDISPEERLSREYDQLGREKAEMEKRLNVALVNNEVTEVSNKTLLQELQEARDTISRLTANNARSMGWDTRLTAALKERDDMQQERDSESHRARLAESRFAALKDKTAKLQSDVRRLQEALEEKRQHRLESSESILTEARSRLESVRSEMGSSAKAEQDGLTRVLETLVNDNETMKKDNAELQRLLSESREDLRALQEEVEEQRANVYPIPRSGPPTPLTRHLHTGTGSVSSIALSPHVANRRNFASETPARDRYTNQEPLTPDSTRRPLSPLDAFSQPDSRWNGFTYPLGRRTSVSTTPISYDLEPETNDESYPEHRNGHRPLLLLNRSRGVQTDPWIGPPVPSPMPSQLSNLSLSTPPDPRSESSSFSESLSSHVSGLFDRATALFSKMTQADALTLTNRLKRQHLKGADLSHLSRTTVSNIVAEAIELRSQFRFLLEDEKIVVACTRKDLRVLFKLLKDMFMELGQLRVSLNDVIFDPSCATKVSEFALNPSKAVAEQKARESSANASGPSWIAPISRLFLGAQRRDRDPGPISRSTSGNQVPRLAPKLGPALAASTTTVNVEFSGGNVGRSTATVAPPQIITSAPGSAALSLAPPATSGVNVMNIFAGAPKPQEDQWVVLPRAGPRRVQSTYLRDAAGTATLGRSTMRKANRLSRNVDAVIDSQQQLVHLPEESEETDVVAPLAGYRTLQRRGLSDSSIHSTFVSHGEDLPSSPTSPQRMNSQQQESLASSTPSTGFGAFPSGIQWADGTSVFQALSRTVQNLRMTTSNSSSSSAFVTPPSEPSESADAGATSTAGTLAMSQQAPPKTNPPQSASSILSSGSSIPNSPVVEQPSPIPNVLPPQSSIMEDPPPSGALSPEGTPKSTIKGRPKALGYGSSTPTRDTKDSQHSGGLVGSFLPSLGITSWVPAANDVLDDGRMVDPFGGSINPGVGGGRGEVYSRRTGLAGREARKSRDFL